MDSKPLCPFRKTTLYDNQNWHSGVAIISTTEEFEPCYGTRCAAYEEYPVSKEGYCHLIGKMIAAPQATYKSI